MSATSPLSPEPRIPSPPSSRDFEIHRLALVEFLSTRRLAEKFHISQTRVRQILARVADWLTEMLPIKSEQDIEKEKRYAIHLAAAQLQHQVETLQNFWDATSDPKYYRQQSRAILALARLGVHSHTLDSLAASAECEAGFQPAEFQSGAGFQPSDSLPPNPDTRPPIPSVSPSVTPSLHHSVSPSLAPSPATSPSQETSSASSSFSIHNSSFPPPPGACSPSSLQASSPKPHASTASDATPSATTDLLLQPDIAKDTLKGLDIQEQRLLTLIDQTYPEQTERLQHLQESLTDLRQARANFILQLGPKFPVEP